jgi:predicted alpha/beta-hydrolase family hydrolase
MQHTVRIHVTVAVLLIATLAVTAVPGDRPPSRPTDHGPFPIGYFNTTVPNAGPFGADAPATVFYPATTTGYNTTPDTSLAPYGTVAFAPGYQATRMDYWPVLTLLAAEGFVVIGVDYDPSFLPNPVDMSTRVGYTLDYLESENVTTNATLNGMVDGARLVSSGHSMGGGVSVMAAAEHARFDFVIPLSPYIIAPLFFPPNDPGTIVSTVTVPMQIVVGSADGTALPALNADVLYANGNCPKSEFTITGADHTFSDPGHRALVLQYVTSWLHYYLEGDPTHFDALFGSGAQADVTAGLITYDYCLDVASIDVTPATATVLLGNTQPFTATVRDSLGTAWGALVTWSTAGGIGTVNGTGVFTATAAGVGTVTASSGGLNATAQVTTGPALAPTIFRAALSGGDLSNVTLEWWKGADDGGPGGPLTYVVQESIGDPIGPFTVLDSVPASGSPSYAYTCVGCGHVPGNLTTRFYRIEAIGGNVTQYSGLAARYAQAVGFGPNLLTVPLVQDDPAGATVLQTLAGTVTTVRTYRAADGADPWKAHYAGRPGDLDAIPVSTGFWVDLTGPGQYTVAGLVAANTTIALEPGWNLVGYVSLVDETVAASLAGLPILDMETFAAPAPPYRLRALSTTETLTLGDALWIRVATGGPWIQG